MKKSKVALAVGAVASILGVAKFVGKSKSSTPINFEGRYEMDGETISITDINGEVVGYYGKKNEPIKKVTATYNKRGDKLTLISEDGIKIGTMKLTKNSEIEFHNALTDIIESFNVVAKDKIKA